MTDQEINVAICQIMPASVTIMNDEGDWVWNRPGPRQFFTPATDLNAMHEAELAAIFSIGKGMVYGRQLHIVCSREGGFEYRNIRMERWDFAAKARQRAETLLRVWGKWEEE